MLEDLQVNSQGCWVLLIASLKVDLSVKVTLGVISDANPWICICVCCWWVAASGLSLHYITGPSSIFIDCLGGKMKQNTRLLFPEQLVKALDSLGQPVTNPKLLKACCLVLSPVETAPSILFGWKEVVPSLEVQSD